MIAVARLLEAAFVLLIFVNGREFFAALHLMFKLVFVESGILRSLGGATDFANLLGGLFVLHHRCLQDRILEWIDLGHWPVRRRFPVYLSAPEQGVIQQDSPIQSKIRAKNDEGGKIRGPRRGAVGPGYEGFRD